METHCALLGLTFFCPLLSWQDRGGCSNEPCNIWRRACADPVLSPSISKTSIRQLRGNSLLERTLAKSSEMIAEEGMTFVSSLRFTAKATRTGTEEVAASTRQTLTLRVVVVVAVPACHVNSHNSSWYGSTEPENQFISLRRTALTLCDGGPKFRCRWHVERCSERRELVFD